LAAFAPKVADVRGNAFGSSSARATPVTSARRSATGAGHGRCLGRPARRRPRPVAGGPCVPALLVAKRDQRQQLVADVGGGNGGHLRVIVGGRRLRDVPPPPAP